VVRATHRSINEIREIEENALERRSLAERIGDWISVRAGQLSFVILHMVWFAVWIGLNTRDAKHAFDPYPFNLLTMVVSLESIFLSLFILISQNRATRQADQRAHLDLQINLLAEHENTKMLEMLRALCQKSGLDTGHDPELDELIKPTKPQQVVQELEKNLPR
jgi:uncharacterized membrane protein